MSPRDEDADSVPPVAIEDDVPTFSEKLIGELVGTFILTLAVACASAQKLPAPAAPLSVAAILIGLIYSFGPLSGAIFNPAVSVAFLLRNRMSHQTALSFAGVQTLGALLAGLVGAFIYGESSVPIISDPSTPMGWLRASLAEILFTGTIVQAVLHCGTTRAQENNHVTGLAVGLVVFGCAVCSSISGSVFNPAIGTGLWIAKGLLRGGLSWAHILLYIFAPSIGAILSTGAFLATRPREP